QTGLTVGAVLGPAAPAGGCGGGGGAAPGLICATAALFNATPPTRTAQARARRMRETVVSSGMKANLAIAARVRKPRAPHIAASTGSVTSFRGQPCDRNLAFNPVSAGR